MESVDVLPGVEDVHALLVPRHLRDLVPCREEEAASPRGRGRVVRGFRVRVRVRRDDDAVLEERDRGRRLAEVEGDVHRVEAVVARAQELARDVVRQERVVVLQRRQRRVPRAPRVGVGVDRA